MNMKKRIRIFVCVTFLAVAALLAVLLTLRHENENNKNEFLRVEDAYVFENAYTFSTFAKTAGDYELRLFNPQPQEMKLEINGIVQRAEWKKNRTNISLNKGINSITLTVAEKEDGKLPMQGISVKGCEKMDVGASVLYTTYEAEEGETNGSISEENRDYYTLASEASGRRYVELKEDGEYVSFTLTEPANALVIRYCIPDSSDGKGLEAVLGLYAEDERLDLKMTSKYSWVYGAFPWNNDPTTEKNGKAHHFFDDVRILLKQTYPQGTVIQIKMEKETAPEYCLIDCIEAEEVDAPLKMPENAINVENYGAAADDGVDDSMAIAECIAAAAEQKKEVFIPEGEFEIRNPAYIKGIPLNQNDVTIRGAGMWHTILNGDAAGFVIRAGNISLYDFSMLGNVTSRKDSIDPPAINMVTPVKGMENIKLQNIWIEHYKVGLWADVTNGISMMGCRIRNTYADGINLCGGTSNCVIINNDLRNTGDDGIAMFNRGVLCVNNKVLYNTVALPWLANNIALYGGKDIVVSHNLLKDTICFGGGVNISTNFNPQVFTGTILIEDNTMLRCGSRENNIGADYGAVWINTVEGFDNTANCVVRNNQILDSTYQGISFYNTGNVENMMIVENEIVDCGTWGIDIGDETKGSAVIRDNLIERAKAGKVNQQSQKNFTVLE